MRDSRSGPGKRQPPRKSHQSATLVGWAGYRGCDGEAWWGSYERCSVQPASRPALPSGLDRGQAPLRYSGARVGLAVAGLEALDGYVGVDLGGRGRGMAEDLLDAAQVGTALE